MDKLWAPWRLQYITGLDKKKKGCIFCRILKEKKDKQNFVFIRTKHSYAVLNIYPYNNGHVLLVPNRHLKDISDLTRGEREDLLDLLDTTKALLQKVLNPKGYNVGMNLGRIAGGGIPGHLHIHLVPRWRGDVNFMPVVANTKVISQSLEVLYAKLSQAYQKKHLK
jgi:ATP adenylyltransferase